MQSDQPFSPAATTSGSTSPWSKSILSRFSSPLSKRSRANFDFSIEVENQYKIYRPGDVVKGNIVLTVQKGFDITHLVVALHGWVQVFRYQRVPGEALVIPDPVLNAKGSAGFDYHGNGLASLFQDEQVLCGGGFLKKHIYKFGFELQFPPSSLPSTLDFERGNVTYMLTATLTKPTTLAPTTTENVRINFKDRIDIKPMYVPKSRAISLEPVVRMGKVKRVRQTPSLNTQDTPTRSSLSRQSTTTSIQTRHSAAIPPPDTPLSPTPSENTVQTQRSASTQEYEVAESASPVRKASPQESEARSSTTSTSAHTITATTEIPRYGALPGESIPIHISISHTKPARGVVIATLYRQGRIDMHPALPLASSYKGKNSKLEYEDVYIKSKTGLSHLYFTNTTPNMAFRKDLTQSSTLMVVDPNTKSADVRLNIKIPSDAFPSITNIPGGMVSFTYHIEVVVDLAGKLNESKILPIHMTNRPKFTAAADTGNQLTSDWANTILDTSSLRRTKSVATFEFPLTIGTDDSTPKQQPTKQQKHYYQQNGDYDGYSRNGWDGQWQQGQHQDPGWYEHGYSGYDGSHNNYYDPNNFDGYEHYDGYDGNWTHDEYGNPVPYDWRAPPPQPGAAQPPYIPPPEGERHEDEKSRLRRQEELLLPSQPPADGPSSSSAVPTAPTAPDLAPVLQVANSPRPSIPITISRASARSAETVVGDPLTPPPSLPDDAPIPEGITATEDKQELERRRLLAQASAPPSNDEDNGEGSSSNHQAHAAATAPSAPVFDDDEYTSQTLNHGVHTNGSSSAENLPQYHR